MPSIDIDGLRMAYDDVGVGLPIVFIPGLTGTKEWFRYQSLGLQQNHRVITCDIRPARSVAAYNLDLLTSDLKRLLTRLRLPSAVIAGYSFGGMIAQKFAVEYPDKVDALILMSSFANLSGMSGDAITRLMSPGAPPPAERGFKAVLRKLFHARPVPPPADVEGLDWLAWHSARMNGVTLPARVGLVQRFDSTDMLKMTEVPTLVMVGADDDPMLLSNAQTLYEQIPDAELEVIENCGHYCFYTRHDIVNDAIDDFLKDRVRSL